METFQNAIGRLVHGGVRKNLLAALDVPPESVEIGSYVRIDGHKNTFFAQVADLSYGTGIDPRFGEQPIQSRVPPNLACLINHVAIKPYAEIALALSCDLNDKTNPTPSPVVTLPPLHAQVSFTDDHDLARIFGDPDGENHWVVGYTKRQSHPLALNIRKLVQRSMGLFGSTGSGKSGQTRGLLAGIIHKNAAVSLVMDLHSDFAYDDRSLDGGVETIIPGLKTMFPKRVLSFGLGKNTSIRGHVPDHILEIDINTVLPKDILCLSEELNLTENSATVLGQLWANFGKGWLQAFLSMTRGEGEESSTAKTPTTVADWAKKRGKVNVLSAEALYSKLLRLRRLPYLVTHSENDCIQQILTAFDHHQHIVLSFGDNFSLLDYLFVSNYLARRVCEAWQEQADLFRSSKGAEPQQLVIVIEEGHRFLNREIGSQSIYGSLAREMRKNFCSLVVVTQRPSDISEDILSQLGARFCGLLTDERDIEAFLAGLPNKDVIRRMISGLAPRGEMVIAGGWVVPMPVAIKTRWIDAKFVQEIQKNQPGILE